MLLLVVFIGILLLCIQVRKGYCNVISNLSQFLSLKGKKSDANNAARKVLTPFQEEGDCQEEIIL